ARLCASHAFEAIGKNKVQEINDCRWYLSYWTWVSIVFFIQISSEIITSILTIHKTWFGWSSFCISPAAWTLMLLAVLGFARVISGRFLRNAIIIREMYQTRRQLWHEDKEFDLPEDPTIDFLGESWWKLPAIVFTFFAVLWFIVEFLGLPSFLSQFFH